MNKYQIIQASNLDELEQKVNQQMQAGYNPIGGISVTASEQYGFGCFQAMILPEDDIEGFIENDICKACNFPEIVNEKGVCADCQGKCEKL